MLGPRDRDNYDESKYEYDSDSDTFSRKDYPDDYQEYWDGDGNQICDD